MTTNYFIESYCHIKRETISLNGQTIFKNDDTDVSKFFKSAALHLKTEYPKFFKMDDLSKLAFLAADILLKATDHSNNVALVFSNKSSSLKTDRKHQRSISDKTRYFPSPSVFVYTLPNICMGEISIRHQLHSENTFLVLEQFNAGHLHINADYLLKNNKADKALCGWVNFEDNNYDAFLYLVSENGNFAHLPKEIDRLYHSK